MKIQNLTAEMFRVWVNFMCACCNTAGYLPPPSDLAFLLRVTEKKAIEQRTRLVELKLVDQDPQFKMHDWDRWQFRSDSSTERVKKFRSSSKKQSGNVSCNGPGNGLRSVSVSVSDSVLKNSETSLPENPLLQRFDELVSRWPNPVGIDHAMQMWIVFVDSGELTSENIDQVFDGFDRYKASDNWAKGFRMRVDKWLIERRWKDFPKPAEVDSWATG